MKKTITSFITVLLTVYVFAQAPQKMSYQAVIRNASNTLVTSQVVGMRISILQGSTSGTVIYQETYSPKPQTNANGLVIIEIGGGTPTTGIFSSIDWSSGPYFLKTETDPAGGANYTIVGISQLLSIPYALYSEVASNISGINGSTFIGQGAGNVSTGTNNVFVGDSAGAKNTTGNFNTAVGHAAFNNNLDGRRNTAIGGKALYSNTSGIFNTSVGHSSLLSNISGSNNAAFGRDALFSNTTGYSNVAIGIAALHNNTTGINLVAVGDSALLNNVADPFINDAKNVAIGSKALYSNTTGNRNTANGYTALYNNTGGYNNTAIGCEALYSNLAVDNTAVGYSALYNNTTGYYNTAVGDMALLFNTTGIYNTANGANALFNNTTGDLNTANGGSALSNNKTGYLNTAIGYNANVSSSDLTNATAIGAEAVVNASNKVRIGSVDVTVIEGQVAYSYPSDKRLKTNITDLNKGLDLIMNLRPVEYQLKLGDGKTNFGFIAQDIESLLGVNNSILTIGGDKDRTLGLRYTDFIAPMVKAIQEQQKEIEELKALVNTLIANQTTQDNN